MKMGGTFLKVACTFSILSQIISGQLLPNAEIIGPAMIPEIAMTETFVGPNMALTANVPLGPSLGLNNMASMAANNMANVAANNLALATNMAFGANRGALGQIGPMGPVGPAVPTWGGGFGFGAISPAAMAPPVGLAASHGGGFTVTSSSPIAPTGLSITSENTIEGPLIVSGQLPFLGTVAVDGAYPTAGMGAVTYGCGDGSIGMVQEGVPAAPSVPMMNAGYGPAMAPGLNYNGLGGRVGYGGMGGIY